MKEIERLNERFIKDYKLNIDKGIAYFNNIFYKRLLEFKYYNSNIINKYDNFIKEIELNFKTVDEYYAYRNKLADTIIKNLCDNQEKYIYSNKQWEKESKERFPINKLDIPSNGCFKENLIEKDLLSIDLKSANFTSLRLYNTELVNNTINYDEFIRSFSNLSHIIESKYFRQRIFGKTNIKFQMSIQRSITNSLAKEMFNFIKKEDFISVTNDEIIILKPENFKDIKKDFLKFLNKKEYETHIESFHLKKIIGTSNGYLKTGKNLNTNEDIFKIYGIPAMIFPYVLELLYELPHDESYDYFTNQEGFLSKFVTTPKIRI